MDKKPNIATATVGEGSSNQGDFHEGLNFAGVHQLPFVCVIINNKYAISVPDSLQYAAKIYQIVLLVMAWKVYKLMVMIQSQCIKL